MTAGGGERKRLWVWVAAAVALAVVVVAVGRYLGVLWPTAGRWGINPVTSPAGRLPRAASLR